MNKAPQHTAPGSPHSTGCFVVFEGGDGAGKSTQVEPLRRRCEQAGHHVVVTREPGGTELGAMLRNALLHGAEVAPRAEALLFAADRAQHVEQLIMPALKRGSVVISDRFMDSSIAYQGAGRALSGEEVRDLSLWATGGLLPHVTVLLDVAVEQGQQRRGSEPDRMEREDDGFHARVREGFVRLAQAEPSRYLVLEASASIEDIADQVWQRVEPLLAPQTSAAAGQGVRS